MLVETQFCIHLLAEINIFFFQLKLQRIDLLQLLPQLAFHSLERGDVLTEYRYPEHNTIALEDIEIQTQCPVLSGSLVLRCK
ncbi:MAG: hypothetical protein MZV49_09820 [Rhodopseudomonas palustris]|nr:hypothetical protein [Rhodopseudomonas palustris]